MPHDYRLYSAFASETRKSFRFIRSGKSEQLLNLVRDTMGKRSVRLPEGKRLARAQIGYEWRPTEVRDPEDTVVDIVDEPWPYPSESPSEKFGMKIKRLPGGGGGAG